MWWLIYGAWSSVWHGFTTGDPPKNPKSFKDVICDEPMFVEKKGKNGRKQRPLVISQPVDSSMVDRAKDSSMKGKQQMECDEENQDVKVSKGVVGIVGAVRAMSQCNMEVEKPTSAGVLVPLPPAALTVEVEKPLVLSSSFDANASQASYKSVLSMSTTHSVVKLCGTLDISTPGQSLPETSKRKNGDQPEDTATTPLKKEIYEGLLSSTLVCSGCVYKVGASYVSKIDSTGCHRLWFTWYHCVVDIRQ